MTAIVHTVADVQTEILQGGAILAVTGSATVFLLLMRRKTGSYEAWSVTP